MSDSQNHNNALPVSCLRKTRIERLRVGWHVRNAKGQIGIVTWISADSNALMYRLDWKQILNGEGG